MEYASKNEMSRIETKWGKATLESRINMSTMEDTLQLDRVAMVLASKPWKVKYRVLQKKDKACKTMTKKIEIYMLIRMII